MFVEISQSLYYLVGIAFVLSLLVGKFAAFLRKRSTADERDPRDGRIRSLSADVRVAQTAAERAKEDLARRDKEFAEQKAAVEENAARMTMQTQTIAGLHADLKNSVKKIAELRAEVSDRATENVRSEVRLRDAQTELSVVQASADMLTAGVLDYSAETQEQERPGKARNAK